MTKYFKFAFVLIITITLLLSLRLNSYAAFTLTATPSNTHPDTQINLKWNSYPGALIYTLYRAEGSSSAELIKTIDINVEKDYLSYTDSGTSGAGLMPETSYSYTIRAYSDQSMQNEIASSVATVSTLQMLKPTITSAVFDINSRSVTITWINNSTAAAGSTVKTSLGATISTVTGTGTTCTFTDPGMVNGVSSLYVVQSWDSTTHSSSDSDPVTVVPVAPPSITSSISEGTSHISWGPHPYIENFILERSKYSQSGWSTWQTVDTPIMAGMESVTDVPDTAGMYRYRLAAKADSCFSGYSNISQTVSKPAAPDNLSCVFYTQNRIDLSWTNNPQNESDLIVERKVGSGDYITIATLNKSAVSYSDIITTVPGTDYYYRVSAFESENNKSLGSEYLISATLPSSPTSLQLTLTSDTEINLSWSDNSNNELGFIIEKKTDTGSFTQLASLGANTKNFTDGSVSTGHTYTYRVRAYNHFGNSVDYTNEVSASTNSVKAPNSLEISVISSSLIKLYWTYPATTSSVTVIERKTGIDGNWSVLGQVNSGITTYYDSTVSQNTRYFYRVKAKSGNYIFSASYPNDDTGKEAYTVFSALYLTVVSSTQIDLSWTDNATGETGFKIERRTDSGSFIEVSTTDPNKTTYSDKNVTAGHTYVYRVLLVNSNGGSTIYTNEVSVNTNTVSAPSSLEVTPVSPSQIILTWDFSSPGSFSTIIERKTWESGQWVKIADVESGRRSYIDTGLSDNTQYFYRIKAAFSSNIFSKTYPNGNTDIGAYTKIKTPTNFKGESPSDTQIRLTWTSNSSEAQYVIERKTQLSDYIEIGTTAVNATNWSDVYLIPNTQYTYRLKAKTQTNTSDYSDEITVVCSNLAAPSGLTAEADSSKSIELSWIDNSNNESGFEIWRSSSASSQFELLTSVESNVTRYTDNSLSANTQYWYKVRAYIASGNIYSNYSNSAASVTTVPNAPTNLSYTRPSSTLINLTWLDNSNNESGFKVERKIGTDGPWLEIATLSQNITSYSISAANTGTQYFYRIKAFNTVYNSRSYSNELEISTGIPSAPSSLHAQALSASQVQLSWTDNSNNELGFLIERRQPNGAYKEISRTGPNTTRFIDNGLSRNQQYFYRIRAYNNNGSSPYSDVISVTTKAASTYTDIQTVSWAKSAIENLSERGIIKGKTSTLFAPNDNITRAEFVCLIVRAFSLNKTSAGSFVDVNPSNWFYKEVMTARSLGIISGDNYNYFYPNKPITREDVAVIITRTLKVINKPLPGSSTDILAKFADKNLISSYAAPSMASLNSSNILNGRSETILAPKGNTTRAEAALLISKIIDT
jgi:hypothetical protein